MRAAYSSMYLFIILVVAIKTLVDTTDLELVMHHPVGFMKFHRDHVSRQTHRFTATIQYIRTLEDNCVVTVCALRVRAVAVGVLQQTGYVYRLATTASLGLRQATMSSCW